MKIGTRHRAEERCETHRARCNQRRVDDCEQPTTCVADMSKWCGDECEPCDMVDLRAPDVSAESEWCVILLSLQACVCVHVMAAMGLMRVGGGVSLYELQRTSQPCSHYRWNVKVYAASDAKREITS